LLIALLLLSGGSSAAKGSRDFDKHITEGSRLYAERSYDRAIAEYEAAYQLQAQPALLINIGLCHYKADRPRQALDYYQQALKAKLTREEREEVLANVAKATIKLQEQQQREAREAREAEARHEAERQRLAMLAASRPPPPPEKPIYKKAWFWAIIGGATVAGLAIGLGVGLRPMSMPGPNPDDVIPVM
jgi:tetratricopeptide (TPR) repeat protein